MDFVGITSDNNWFKKYPQKIAGEEYLTTSLYFPVMVKGTKEDVLRVTGIKTQTNTQRIKIAKSKAIALQLKRKRNERI